MELREAVARRRMVRNYRPDPVDPEVVTRILDVARRAPSAGFSQGQRFVVVTDAETRKAVADLGDEEHYVREGFDPWMSTAPVHVVVCADERAYRQRYAASDKGSTPPDEQVWPVPYWHVDAGASLMLLLLAAVDEGLAAGFFGSHRLEGIQMLLAIPEGCHPIGVVTLGHAADDRRSGSLARGWRDLDDVVHWQRWRSEPGA